MLVPILAVNLLLGAIDLGAASYGLALFWLAGFGLLALNNSHMFACSLVALWPGKEHIRETESSYGRRTDLLYVVRNENTDLLLTTMSASLLGAIRTNVRMWLLSNSDDPGVRSAERGLIDTLQNEFGTERVGLFETRKNPLWRKHVCVHEWLEGHPEACYMLICDADTVLPAGSVDKLVRKAEHPDNAGVALFQAHIRVASAETRFSRMLSFGQEIAQRLYSSSHQRVFGRSAYYGSGCLIRADAYRKVQIPSWVLSHDVWETVALERQAGRVVYCGDVVTFGRFPHNMLDFIRRSRRWIVGTLETMPLLAVPGIPLGTRFLVLLPIYFYLSQLLLFIWLAMGLAVSASTGPLIAARSFVLAGSGSVHLEMSSCLVFTMAIVFGHRFAQCRTVKDVWETALELAASTALCLNCIVFDSLTVLRTLVQRKRGHEWIRSEKQNRPLTLRDVAQELWLSTSVGIVAATIGFIYAPNWTLVASPFLLSLCVGIPATLWTAGKPGSN